MARKVLIVSSVSEKDCGEEGVKIAHRGGPFWGRISFLSRHLPSPSHHISVQPETTEGWQGKNKVFFIITVSPRIKKKGGGGGGTERLSTLKLFMPWHIHC